MDLGLRLGKDWIGLDDMMDEIQEREVIGLDWDGLDRIKSIKQQEKGIRKVEY